MKAILRFSAILIYTGTMSVLPAEQHAANLYKTNCAPCHGASGDASTPAGKVLNVPSFTSEAVLRETDANMLEIAEKGKGKMPAWHDKLSEDQLKDLIAFIHSMQKK
jgi:mono/diheme cytochrome c family protein